MWNFLPRRHVRRLRAVRRRGLGLAEHYGRALRALLGVSAGRLCKRFTGVRSDLIQDGAGHGLLEVALLLPFLIVVVINAVNLGYVFSVYLNLSTAPRQGAEYSTHGTSTALETAVPTAASVSSLVYDNINTSVPSAANSPTQVCSMALGLSGSGTTQVPNCATYNSGTAAFAAPQPDPEAPYLVLHRVDIQYTVRPLLQGSIFNVVPDQLTLHRTVMMRAMP